jgi:1-acyl-sn-glycerol-3-phosphate acyltransferase
MLLGCFPEGGISTSGEMRDAKAGIGLLAVRTGCPVVPIRLSGYRFQSMPKAFFLPKRISIRIGKPLRFEGEDHRDRETLVQVTNRIVEVIEELGKD